MAGPRRTERVSDEIRRRLTELIRRELKDPRVSVLSSITRVQMSPDLRYAKPHGLLRPGGAMVVAGCQWARPADAGRSRR